MRSDAEIKRNVENELRWNPALDAADLAVDVRDGVVMLSGFARSYADKYEAERTVKRVGGVLGVANDVEVRLQSIDKRPDPEIARDAVSALRNELPFSFQNIKVIAKDGWLTLEGEVEWNYQRERAERAIRRVTGVVGVSNLIRLKPQVGATDIKQKIEDAFKRSAEVDARNLTVEVNGSHVILHGTVHSWTERREAERAAYAAPGITKVDNRLTIRP